MKTIQCKSCSNEFSGTYCNQCGEKVLEEKDFTLGSIIKEAIGAITNFDSKVFRSLGLLLFRPGQLSKNHVEGIRVNYMKPFQIFVIANILFFIFLSNIDLFRTPSKWFFVENFDGIEVLKQVREIATEKNITIEEVATLYDVKSSNLAKGFVILLVPFIGIIGLLLHFRQKIPYGKHIIFAIHYFTLMLLIFVIWTQLLTLLGSNWGQLWLVIPISLITLIYYVIGLRIFYKNNWTASIWKGLVGAFFINFLIQVYRVTINVISLNTL